MNGVVEQVQSHIVVELESVDEPDGYPVGWCPFPDDQVPEVAFGDSAPFGACPDGEPLTESGEVQFPGEVWGELPPIGVLHRLPSKGASGCGRNTLGLSDSLS